MAVGKLDVLLGLNAKNFEKGLKRSQRQLKSYATKIGGIGDTINKSITLPFALGAAASIKFASDYEESVNKIDVAFKESAKGVKDWGQTTLQAFGIASGTALEMAANFGDMSTSLGVGEKEAANISTTLVGLAGDLASFKNIRIDVAQTALSSIFTAETESLKKLGIVMTQDALNEFARSQGIAKTIKKMTEREKVMLRYNFILKMTKNSQGDFVRTGGNAANQMRIFTETLKEAAINFGQLLLPMFTKGIKVVNKYLTAFANMDDGTKRIIISVGAFISILGLSLKATSMAIHGVVGMSRAYRTLRIMVIKTAGQFAKADKMMKRTAIGFLVAGIAAAVYIFSEFNSELKKLDKNLTNSRVKIRQEEVAADKLFAAIKSNTTGYADKKEALEKLQGLYPNLLTNMSVEESSLDDLKKAQDRVNKSIRERIVLEMKGEALAAIQKKIIETQIALQDTLSGKSATIGMGQAQAVSIIKGKIKDLEQSLKDAADGFDMLLNPDIAGGGTGLAWLDKLQEAAGNVLPIGVLAPKAVKKKTSTVVGGGGKGKDPIEEQIKKLKRLARLKARMIEIDRQLEDFQIVNPMAQFDETDIFGNVVRGLEDVKYAAGGVVDILGSMPEIAADAGQGLSDMAQKKEDVEWLESAMGSLGNVMASSISSMIESGEDFATSFRKAAVTIIKQLIQLAVAFVMKDAIAKGGVLGLVVAPVLGAAASALFQAGINKVSPPKLAEGGIATGRSLVEVGEYSGASTNGEMILPINRLPAMLQKAGIGGGSVNVTGEFEIRGDKLVMLIDRTRQQQSRI